MSFEAFKDVYRTAYDTGGKGCTTYRPNPVRDAVLQPEDKVADTFEPIARAPMPALPAPVARSARSPKGGPSNGGGDVIYMTKPLDRPSELAGQTYKVRWPDLDHAFYITINDIDQDGRQRPFEIFINSKNMEHDAWTVSLTCLISAVFRPAGEITSLSDGCKAVCEPRGV